MTFVSEWRKEWSGLYRVPQLQPDETWLLEHLYAHTSGIYSPTIDDLLTAARTAGIKITKTRAYAASKGLQAKRLLQVKSFTWQQVRYHFRSLTKMPGQFDVDLDVVDQDWLVERSEAFNRERRRPDVVAKVRREQAKEAEVIRLDDHRVHRAG